MDRRQQKTKIAIHQAMTTLLKKKKFEALTVQDIIDEANIGGSTFYSHFETKEELLEEICREMFAHVFSKDLAPEKKSRFFKRTQGLCKSPYTYFVSPAGSQGKYQGNHVRRNRKAFYLIFSRLP